MSNLQFGYENLIILNTFRLIFLGAGFSKAAGLPLGSELFVEVRRLITSRYGRDNILERDLKLFLEYLNKCEGRLETNDSIDYEEFLSYLDIEHYLGLKGKDTWSSEGNESQLMIRRAIAQILYERTPKQLPTSYGRFVRKLNHTDFICTFNYDTILESALEAEGIAYRLYPFRFSEIGSAFNTVDNFHDELVILKLHGSINWFDRNSYEERVLYAHNFPITYDPKHPVFGPDAIVEPIPLTEGPRTKNDPLASIFRVLDIAPLFNRGFWECCPFILQPSRTKLLYSQPLRDFWWGIQRMGGLQLSLGVIGYSLPPYDSYARQVLYHVFMNYTGYEPDLELIGRRKTKIRILDYRPDVNSVTELQARYRFAEPDRTETRLDGFNEETADWFLR